VPRLDRPTSPYQLHVAKALVHDRSALTESCRKLLEAERVERQSNFTALRQVIEGIWQFVRNESNRREEDSMQKSLEWEATNTKLDSLSRSLQTESRQRECDFAEALEGAARVYRELKPEVLRAQQTADTLKTDSAAWVEATKHLRGDLLQLGRELDAHKASTRINRATTLARDGRVSPAAQGGEAITWASTRPMATQHICPTLNNTGHGGELSNSAEAAALQGSIVKPPVTRVRTAPPEHITLQSSSDGNNTADSLVKVVINTAADMKLAGQCKTSQGLNSGGLKSLSPLNSLGATYNVAHGNIKSVAGSPKPVLRMQGAGPVVPMASTE